MVGVFMMPVGSLWAVEHKNVIRGIESYRQNYLLVYSYNDRNNFNAVYGAAQGAPYQQQEVKFQISFQGELAHYNGYNLGLSYTQQSYWQLFNKPLSSPFRENNFEPELFIRWDDARNDTLDIRRYYRLGFDHQSNGRSNPLSRSWNRLYGELSLGDKDDQWLAVLRGWARIPEKAANDDNPDITRFYGFWQFDGRWSPTHEHALHLMLRDNLRSKNRGAVQLDWSWKVFSDFSLYVQMFHGYGENLIEYNQMNTRVGAGILMTNW